MLKFAIVGMGVMGKNHLKVLRSFTDIEVVGVCDPVAVGDFGCELFRDLDQMLSTIKIDALIIATPTFLHCNVALKCLDRGINLLIEKPLAINLNEANAIKQVANKSLAKVAVGHIERFNPAIISLKNELRERQIYQINTTRISPFPSRITDVGVLADLGVHDIDLIRFISGAEILDCGSAKLQKLHTKCEDDVILNFKLCNNITASSHVSWLYPFKKRLLEVVCGDGVFEADLIAQELKFYSKIDNAIFGTKGCFVKKGDSLVNELIAFVEFLRGSQNHLATLDDGLATLKFI